MVVGGSGGADADKTGCPKFLKQLSHVGGVQIVEYGSSKIEPHFKEVLRDCIVRVEQHSVTIHAFESLLLYIEGIAQPEPNFCWIEKTWLWESFRVEIREMEVVEEAIEGSLSGTVWEDKVPQADGQAVLPLIAI